MQKKKKHPSYPWQSPLKLLYLFIALIFSAYLTVYMPAHSPRQRLNTDQKKEKVENIAQTKVDVLKKQPNYETHQSKEYSKNTEQHPKPQQQISNTETIYTKLWKKIKSFTRLFSMVAIAAFLAGIMEARAWHIYLGSFLRGVTKAARLPQVIGISMPVALYSNASANALLVSSHEQGKISTSSLICGGMANSYLAHFSHSIRVFYPVVALIGLSGVLYFSVQLLGGFLVIVGAFCFNRYKFRHRAWKDWQEKTPENHKKVLEWKSAIRLGIIRSLSLLFRICSITVPLMIAMEWLLKSGVSDYWAKLVPSQVVQYFPAESVSIILAQMGGLVQSAGVSAHLYAEGLVHPSQVVLAMLVASALGNPIRTLRRNLPTALGVFPPKVAFTIVFTMQFARFLITVIGSILVILWMKIYLFG